MLCCGYTLTDFPISIRLISLALWQSNDCPSASKATLMNMDKCFMWIHYERLHYRNKAKHNKTVCIFLGIYCICPPFGWDRINRSRYIDVLHWTWKRVTSIVSFIKSWEVRCITYVCGCTCIKYFRMLRHMHAHTYIKLRLLNQYQIHLL